MGKLRFDSTLKADSNQSTNLYNAAVFSLPLRGMPVTTPYNLEKYSKIFDTNALIYALIDWKASRACEIKPEIYKIKDTSAAKEYKKWNGIYVEKYELKKLAALKSAAYEEIDLSGISVDDRTYGKLKKILKQPSPLFNWKQYIYHIVSTMDVSGFQPIWGNRLTSGLNAGKFEGLYPLPAYQTEIIGGTSFDPIRGYKIKGNDYTKEFLAEDVMLLRSHSFNYDSQGSFLYGTPRVKVALKEIDTYNASKERELYGFQTGDSSTIIFPRDKEVSEAFENQGPEEKEGFISRIFKRLKQKNRENVAITGFPLDSIKIDTPLSESRTNEAQKSIIEILCAVWHISPVLMGSQESSSYNNLKEVGKISLRDAVFPVMREVCEAHDDFLIPTFGKDLTLQFDFDVFEEFSEDIKVQAEALEKMPFLSDNEKRAWIDYDPIEDERANLPQSYWDIGYIPNDGTYNDTTGKV